MPPTCTGASSRWTAPGRSPKAEWTGPRPTSAASCRCPAWYPLHGPPSSIRNVRRIDGPAPAVATLKIGMAMFGTRAILNGRVVGDHPPSFTPGYFDLRDALVNGQNELLIRVGADRAALPPG